MTNKYNKKASGLSQDEALMPFPATSADQRTQKLMRVCVELLELCIEVTGTIDPAAAWLVAQAKDEVRLSMWDTRDLRPY